MLVPAKTWDGICWGFAAPLRSMFPSAAPASLSLAKGKNDCFLFGNHQRHCFFQSVFKNYDHDQDGYISQEEFEKIAASFPFSFCVMDKDRWVCIRICGSEPGERGLWVSSDAPVNSAVLLWPLNEYWGWKATIRGRPVWLWFGPQ